MEKGLNIKEVSRHSKASVLKSILDKSQEPGLNLIDLKRFIYSELEKINYLVVDGNLESVK